MKRMLLSFSMLVISVLVFGQGEQSLPASFAMQKSSSAVFTILDQKQAAMIILPYSSDVVLNAMQEFEARSNGSKKNQSDAYLSMYETELMKKNKSEAPLVFQVGQSTPKQKDQTIVYLMLDSPVDAGRYAGTTQRFESDDATAYLENLSTAIQVITLDRQIKAYTAKLRKVENKQEHYAKRCDKLNDRKASINEKDMDKKSVANKDHRLEARIEESENALALQKATVEKQRSDLSLLTNQRNSFDK